MAKKVKGKVSVHYGNKKKVTTIGKGKHSRPNKKKRNWKRNCVN